MIAVLSVVEIYPDREEVWRQVWQQVEATHRAAEGFHSVRLFHDADQPERYVVLSEWEDRSHYDSFIRHIGVPWLHDAWEYAPESATVLFLVEETRP
jgi:heme-degrading monooxygenase HmoA